MKALLVKFLSLVVLSLIYVLMWIAFAVVLPYDIIVDLVIHKIPIKGYFQRYYKEVWREGHNGIICVLNKILAE